jgi:hypothetical protein
MIVIPRAARPVRVTATLALVAAAAIALAACSGSPSSSDGSSASPSATHSSGNGSATTTPTPSSTPSPTGPTPGGTPVNLTCDQILTPQQVYNYNPNFGDDPGYKPAAGSLAAKAVADKGVACAWLNQTSGVVIQISVAQPDAANLTAQENSAVTTSTAVPTYGVPQGYFSTARGEAQVFTGAYWIAAVAPTTTFTEPGDPAPLIQDVQQNLAAQ